MTQITIRGMDPEMEQEIRRMARKSGKSLNHTILDMIYQYTGYKKREKRSPADSLRKLAGGWSEKKASEFLETIKSCEQVDEEMWK
jgi:hypothetical protein